MPEIRIANKIVGPVHPPLVVAEIGINRGGSLKIAFKIVDATMEAGLEVVKHQTLVVSDKLSSAAKKLYLVMPEFPFMTLWKSARYLKLKNVI
mgnify:CR=1 FL=1